MGDVKYGRRATTLDLDGENEHFRLNISERNALRLRRNV